MTLLKVELIDLVYCSNEVFGLRLTWPGLSPEDVMVINYI
jgi:hypothetical protein